MFLCVCFFPRKNTWDLIGDYVFIILIGLLIYNGVNLIFIGTFTGNFTGTLRCNFGTLFHVKLTGIFCETQI